MQYKGRAYCLGKFSRGMHGSLRLQDKSIHDKIGKRCGKEETDIGKAQMEKQHDGGVPVIWHNFAYPSCGNLYAVKWNFRKNPVCPFQRVGREDSAAD